MILLVSTGGSIVKVIAAVSVELMHQFPLLGGGGGSNLLYGVWIFMKQHMRKRPCTQLVSKYTWHVIQMCTSS